jgi:uncharacterized membrane protein AbrB (regulator of aidB expression)
VKITHFISFAAILTLAACTPAQEQLATADVALGCHVVTAAEAADPTFVQHNGKVITGQSIGCTLAPIVINTIPAPAAPAAPAP